jgi:hypothetical protein
MAALLKENEEYEKPGGWKIMRKRTDKPANHINVAVKILNTI